MSDARTQLVDFIAQAARALSAAQRLDAEVAAMRYTLRAMGPSPANAQLRDAYLIAFDRITDRRMVIEEAARMVIDPPDLPVTTVEGWGDAVIQNIHARGVEAEALPAEVVAVELARLSGAPLPPDPGAVASEPQPDADELAPDAGAAA